MSKPREMKDGLPVIDMDDVEIDLLSNVQMDINDLTTHYAAELGRLSGELVKLQATAAAFERHARKVIAELQAKIPKEVGDDG